MADEQQARDAEAVLHLTNELLATVDAYIGRQPGGKMPVAVVADGVAGLAGSVAVLSRKRFEISPVLGVAP